MGNSYFDTTRQALEESRRRIEQQRKSAAKDLTAADEFVNTTGVLFDRDVTKVRHRKSEVRSESMDALKDLENFDAGLGGFMVATGDGLLGAVGTMLRGRKANKVTQLKYKAASLEDEEDELVASYTEKLDRVNRHIQSKEKILKFTEDGFADLGTMLQLGIDISTLEINQAKAFDEQTQRMLKGASVGQLLLWRARPEEAPEQLRDSPGLIDAALDDKYEGRATRERAQTESRAALREEALDSMDTESLQAMIDTGNIPDYLNVGGIQDEVRRRQRADLDLRSAALAQQAGELDHAQQLKDHILGETLSLSELQEGIDAATQDPNGIMDLGGVAITAQEFMDAYAVRVENDAQNSDKIAKSIMHDPISLATENYLIQEARSLHGIYFPGQEPDPDQPWNSLPAPKRFAAVAAHTKYQAGIQLGNKTMMDEGMSDLNAVLDEAKQGAIESQPKSSQGAMREFIETGKISNPLNAASFLFDNTANPHGLGYNDGLNLAYQSFAQTLVDLKNESETTIRFEDGQPVISGGKGTKDPAVFVENAIVKSGAREIAAGAMAQVAFRDAMEQIIKSNPEYAAAFKSFYNIDTGNFANRVYNVIEGPDGEGELQFSHRNLKRMLAEKTVEMQASGELDKDTSLIDIFLKQLRISAYARRSLDSVFQGDIGSAAFGQSLFRGNAASMLEPFIQEYARDSEVAMIQARDDQKIKEGYARAQAEFAAQEQARVGPFKPAPAFGGLGLGR